MRTVVETAKIAIFSTFGIGILIFLIFAGWRLKNYDNLKDQRDAAVGSANTQAQAAQQQAGAATNTGQTYDAIHAQLPAIKVEVDARTDRVMNNANRQVDATDLDPVGNDSLRELDAAEAAARAATPGNQLRRKRAR